MAAKMSPNYLILALTITFSDLMTLSSCCTPVEPGPHNFFAKCASPLPPPCDSQIYCYGPLLYHVQMAKLDHDSKTFVDQKLLRSPQDVILDFEDLVKNTTVPTQDQIHTFLKQNFGAARTELMPWVPSDWKESPAILSTIKDTRLRAFASDLNHIWKDLGRKIHPDIGLHPERYTLINVPNPFIVPGGRFSEFYYWDQYWILRGLLASEMLDTARGMIENLMYMVDFYGFVPNGGRIYYLRSQPPMLIPMVHDYILQTGNLTFLAQHVKTLEKEFRFWLNNRTTTFEYNGGRHRMAHYDSERTGPRPESFREDYNLALQFATDPIRDELFVNLKSGAESGWDFSSRWFTSIQVNNRTVSEGLKNIKTRNIIPADLNAILYNNAKILAQFHKQLHNDKKSAYYEIIASKWHEAINAVLWDPEQGCWFDFDFVRQTRRLEFYPSNIVPLWAGVHVNSSKFHSNHIDATPKPSSASEDRDFTVQQVIQYLNDTGALLFPGGIPTSMEHSGEQWDFPNGWAPLQHFVVEALRNTELPAAKAVAFEVARKWVVNNYETFVNANRTMFEKYDVQSVGIPGGGGEYQVVTGFGWSNGVILDFLRTYGDVMFLPKKAGPKPDSDHH